MKKRKIFYRLILTAAIITLAVGAYYMFLRRPAITGGAMLQGAYIWQHRWNIEPAAAIKKSANKFDILYVLVSETYPVSGLDSLVQTPNVDYKLLASLKTPVCLVVRVGSYSGPFDPDAKISRELLASVKNALEKARSSGVQPCEIQIDFDCAESKLAGYKQWLKMLSRAELGVQLSFTALPSWLNNREFKSLVSQADEFVLQIHSFEPPKAGRDYSILCSRSQAERWIWQAARMGRPFRVALPTYSYMLAFDAKGKFISLAAEGYMQKLPKDATLRRVDSSVDDLAELITEWRKCRLANMKGVIWYRLPTSNDRLNLSQAALDEIMLGRRPASKLSIELRQVKSDQPSDDGGATYDIIIKNSGMLRDEMPTEIVLTWRGGSCLAADGLDGYTISNRSAGKLVLFCTKKGDGHVIRPDGRIAIGWIRLPENTEIRCEIVSK